MTYYDLIIQWFKRSEQEKDYFTKFIFLYISFIAFISQRYGEMSDRNKINSLKAELEAKYFYIRLIEKDNKLKDILVKLIAELNKQPIVNSTNRSDKYWNGRLTSEENWNGLVEFWYRVRNNLFHGHKAPEFKRDQRLVRFAYKTLFPFMKNFIDRKLAWEFD